MMQWALLAIGAPFTAFALIGAFPWIRRTGKGAAGLSIAAISLSLVSALFLLTRYLQHPEPQTLSYVFAPFSTVSPITFGILVDGLAVAMLVVVTVVAWVVQVYSLGYMSEESPSSLGRYYAYHSLFVTSMIGLVLSHNLLQTYVFWELVGACSYLLIGFWFYKPEAARAALKAFWVTRLGDVGFAIGVVLLWAAAGTFTFEGLFSAVEQGTLGGQLLTLGVLGLFVGAMGKSAQFPLHIWLPDAMEGPTPVSALIHAATMVAAGVFLMIRIHPLLAATPEVAFWVLQIGAFTAFLAATMALVERDVKRILAFSTISQLGYMMAAVGAGAHVAAFFHLFTHAFFKALLFLAAGSLIHAMHTNDIFRMGNLWKPMRWTGLYFLVGGLALSGIPPTAGFFSKDEILVGVWQTGEPLAIFFLFATVFLTAFYMFRAFFVVFFGDREAEGHPHESPGVMVGPMGILAVLALVAGFFGHGLEGLLSHSLGVSEAAGETAHVPGSLPWIGSLLGLAGIALAYLGYQARTLDTRAVYTRFHPVATVLERRYFVDDLFLALYRYVYNLLSGFLGWFDRYVVDGVVNFLTWGTWQVARAVRTVQSGQVQDALYAVVLGFLFLAYLAMRF
jgi:NADH-quinone oxidoreductase subunit L